VKGKVTAEIACLVVTCISFGDECGENALNDVVIGKAILISIRLDHRAEEVWDGSVSKLYKSKLPPFCQLGGALGIFFRVC